MMNSLHALFVDHFVSRINSFAPNQRIFPIVETDPGNIFIYNYFYSGIDSLSITTPSTEDTSRTGGFGITGGTISGSNFFLLLSLS